MATDVSPNSCRVCLQIECKMRSLYVAQEDDDEPPYKMLELLTGICLEQLDIQPELPKNICKTCELSLNMAYQFRLKALKAQRTITEFLSEKVYIKNEINNDGTIEMPDQEAYDPDFTDVPTPATEQRRLRVKRERNSPKAARNNPQKTRSQKITKTHQEHVENEIEEITRIEPETEAHTKDLNEEEQLDIETTEQIEEEAIHSDFDDDTALEVEEPAEYLEDDMEYLENVHFATEEDEDDYFNNAERDFEEWQQKEVKKSASKRKRRRNRWKVKNEVELGDGLVEKGEVDAEFYKSKNTTGKVHICDICGNIFEQRGRMMEHRRRHIQDELYTCEICGQGFSLREKLRKHMFLHSGSRPFKCSFCSRSFFYESVKRNHEAVHKGEKPYICDICGRAFAYQHTLKKHKLIHEDIKLYHCEFCNKDFRLQHHMKQHEETRTHQNAVKLCTEQLTEQDVYIAYEESL